MAHEAPLEEYEEEELTKMLVEIEACFGEMGLHRSAERQEVESAVAFEPLDYGDDIEQIHTQLDALSTTWKQIRLDLLGRFSARRRLRRCVLCGARCGASFGFAVPLRALRAGNIWPFVWWPHPSVLWARDERHCWVRRPRSTGVPARGATTVDFAALDWPDFGASMAQGYDAMLVGHDEHGSPLYELNASTYDSGDSDGGGGGGCGGGGCGGGGCGGGGGF